MCIVSTCPSSLARAGGHNYHSLRWSGVVAHRFRVAFSAKASVVCEMTVSSTAMMTPTESEAMTINRVRFLLRVFASRSLVCCSVVFTPQGKHVRLGPDFSSSIVKRGSSCCVCEVKISVDSPGPQSLLIKLHGKDTAGLEMGNNSKRVLKPSSRTRVRASRRSFAT